MSDVSHYYGTPFAMEKIEEPVIPDRILRVEDHIASGQDRSTDLHAIQRAVEACASAGGGTVIVSPGEWMSGPIHLRSHVRLHIEEGAVITFSPRYSDYLPVVFTRWEGMECYNYSPLIYAID